MIRLPDQPLLQSTSLGLTKSSNEGQLASMESAMLEGDSITSLGRAVSDVSDVFTKHLTRIQGIEDTRKVLEGKSQLASQFADHNIKLQSDFDPTSRLVKTKEFFESYEKSMDFTDTSPIAQAKLKDYLLDVRTQGNINQAQDSLMLSTKRSQAATMNRLDSAAVAGNLPEVGAALNEDSTIIPEEKARLAALYEGKIKDGNRKAAIQRDPIKYKADNPVPEDGMSEETWASYDDLASRIIVRDNNKFVSDAYTEIAKENKTPEQVAEDYNLLPSDDILKLKDYARSVANGVLLQKQSDPAYQAEAVGNVQTMLKQLENLMIPPEGQLIPTNKDGTDANPGARRDSILKMQSGILSNINEMPEGAYKIYLKSKLESLVYNVARKNKSVAEVVIADIKTEVDLGRVAPPEMMDLTDALEADFLDSDAKLARIGFDMEDGDVKDAIVEMREAKTTEEKKKIFRRIFSKYVVSVGRLPVTPDGVPSIEVATAQAIETGANQIDYKSPADRDAYIRSDRKATAREGKYIISMFEYQEQHPGATIEKLREEYQRLKAIDARDDSAE
jgi:hypothetical protein